MQGHRGAVRRAEQAMGALLVIMGVLLIAGSFDAIGYELLRLFPALGRIG
jgi:hypothetical protein